jgi:hypothetical protein
MALAPVTVEFHHPGLLYSTYGPPCVGLSARECHVYDTWRSRNCSTVYRVWRAPPSVTPHTCGSISYREPRQTLRAVAKYCTSLCSRGRQPARRPPDFPLMSPLISGTGLERGREPTRSVSPRDLTVTARAQHKCAPPAGGRSWQPAAVLSPNRGQFYSTIRGSQHPRRRSAKGRRARPILGRKVDVARGATLARARPRPKTDQPACLVAKKRSPQGGTGSRHVSVRQAKFQLRYGALAATRCGTSFSSFPIPGTFSSNIRTRPLDAAGVAST